MQSSTQSQGTGAAGASSAAAGAPGPNRDVIGNLSLVTGLRWPAQADPGYGEALLRGVRALYECRATGEVFQRFYSEAPPAVFVDPAGQLSPAIAFRGLAELFSPSPPALARFDVLEADTTHIKLAIECGYAIRALGGALGPLPFKCTTLLTLEPHSGRIVRHEDWWLGRQLWGPDDGLLGRLADARRRLTGAAQDVFVRVTGGAGKDYGGGQAAATTAGGQPAQPAPQAAATGATTALPR